MIFKLLVILKLYVLAFTNSSILLYWCHVLSIHKFIPVYLISKVSGIDAHFTAENMLLVCAFSELLRTTLLNFSHLH